MGGPVVDWDLDKLVEEYGAREKLTPEEDKQLEEDLVKYVNEFEIEELKEPPQTHFWSTGITL